MSRGFFLPPLPFYHWPLCRIPVSLQGLAEMIQQGFSKSEV
jgi:hypothetical protein